MLNKAKKVIPYMRGYIYLGKHRVFLWNSPIIQGKKFISVGKNFGALRNFWMAAIANYQNIKFSPAIEIGDNVSFGQDCHLACINRITIGSGTLAGSRVHITDHNHGCYASKGIGSCPNTPPQERELHSNGPVEIGENVWIGDGVVIVSGVNIGSGAIIGANSVVTNNIPSDSIAVGNPARVIKRYSGAEWHKIG